MADEFRYPMWLYGGPFLRVDDPDRDLPRRAPGSPVSQAMRDQVERDGTVDGERYVAPFGDANSIGDILPSLWRLSDYPHGWSDEERYVYPTVQGLLTKTAMRLESRLGRKPGRVRGAWLSDALSKLRASSELFAAGRYEDARRTVSEAQDQVEQGNRASRRKVRFLVASNGDVEDLGKPKRRS
jgi:hypothetical protein